MFNHSIGLALNPYCWSLLCWLCCKQCFLHPWCAELFRTLCK